tara:strand:- start:2649 stop:3266 length:618 start_codon:yes stop_codon:yes gene_type:complete
MGVQSDVIAVTITADTLAADDDGISVSAQVANNAALVIGGALASGGAVALSNARKVTITSGGDDDEISFTIVGTDINGTAQTEALTGANAGVATSAAFFLTIASITAVGDPAGTVKAGISGDSSDIVFLGRARLKGVFLTSTATAGAVDFLTTSTAGTSLFKISSVASATATRDVVIPDEGVLFKEGIYIQYTVSTFLTLTMFHA